MGCFCSSTVAHRKESVETAAIPGDGKGIQTSIMTFRPWLIGSSDTNIMNESLVSTNN